MRFHILGSSSSGNAAFIETEHCKILVDAGFSGKKLNLLLQDYGYELSQIDAVFLTHEHSDHTAGLAGLSRFKGLPVFANYDTAKAAQSKLKKTLNWKVFDTGHKFKFKDVDVTSFTIPHDAYDPVGFTFESGEYDSLFSPYRKVAWVTDLGYMTPVVKKHIEGTDLLVLEANYEPILLEQNERRPWSLKQRISGRHGHLSNQSALDFLSEVDTPSWRQLCLAHLSKDCNKVELVQEKFSPVGKSKGYKVDVVDPCGGGRYAYDLFEF